MPNPIVNPAILLSPVENGYVAYDPALDRLHHLNPVAALIAELCDGTRSTGEIRDLVAPILPEDKTGEVDRWIEQGLTAGFLIWRGDEAKSHREFSADELVKFAQQLRNKGKVQTAYLCGKHALELRPEDWDMWYDHADDCESLGRRDEARIAYEKYFAAHPEDAEIEHVLVAYRDEPPPPRASNRAIEQIYKGFAETYEVRMVDDLGYVGPQRIGEAIEGVIGKRQGLKVLDLGCGSGLSGMRLKDFAADMTGVDLSPEMLALARARNIYDRLEIAEITAWLDRHDETFDIIAACDCLIYFGDIHDIVAAASKRLNAGGILALTMERGAHYPFRLADTGRYEHHPDHVRDVAAKNGVAVGRLDEKFLRTEYGVDVIAIYTVLQKN